MKFLQIALFVLFLSAVIASCQKDGQPADGSLTKTGIKADTSDNSGNFFADKGTLTIEVDDSTYTFDAAKDSIAFINVNIDSNKYYGLTAINKAHTVSFGISSPGFASPDLQNTIAGGQLLVAGDDKTSKQYSLSPDAGNGPSNVIYLEKYMQDSLITRGTFNTLMSKKGERGVRVVTGSFNLQRK